MKTIYIYSFISRLGKESLVEALRDGAHKNDYRVEMIDTVPHNISESDILVIWNRHLQQDEMAKAFERKGANVWLFENPYIKMPGQEWYSVANGYHNSIHDAPKKRDNGERWRQYFNHLNIKDWKRNIDGHVLIATQSKVFNAPGIGYSIYKQPGGWDGSISREIANRTAREVRYRQHPNGREHGFNQQTMPEFLTVSDGSKRSLEDDLKTAWATVVYTSNTATESLLEGIPVFVNGPRVFMMDACNPSIDKINNPDYPDNRQELFNHMAWAQYSVTEIRNGYLHEIMN